MKRRFKKAFKTLLMMPMFLLMWFGAGILVIFSPIIAFINPDNVNISMFGEKE